MNQTSKIRFFSNIRRCLCLVLAAGCLAGARTQAADDNAKRDDSAQAVWQQDYGPTREERMQWWRAARFGMFIHWGVYSVPAGVWNGTNVTHHGAEWIMNGTAARISMADYQKLPAQFDPTNFDAEQWVRIAKAAGMKYIVITAKHHDGFAMFHSQASAFNIYDATPFHRDPLKELADACARAGIKLGFYYSQAQDWNHPGGAAAGGHWDPAQDGDMDHFIDTVDIPQLKELFSNYGKVAVIWWDTPINMTPERAEKFLPLLKMQPDIISNNRLDAHHSTGDYETPENKIPTNGIPGRDWETCMTMNHTWGYRSYDHDWKSTETIVRNLVDIASKGGNYLLNVGPTSLGEIPAPSVERLPEIGRWMKVNGEAIYDTTASPFGHPFDWGRCTARIMPGAATLYLHVFDWPANGQLMVPGLKNQVASACLLQRNFLGMHKSLAVTAAADGVIISVPATAPDKISTTIVLKIKGAPDIE